MSDLGLYLVLIFRPFGPKTPGSTSQEEPTKCSLATEGTQRREREESCVSQKLDLQKTNASLKVL